jgi:uncharacterized damage-inducible protein DinB
VPGSSRDALTADLIAQSVERLRHYLGQIERCAGVLSAEQLWYRPNEHVNSVANLILHLTGNVRQWIVARVGGEAFERDRSSEFAARDGRPAAEIIPQLRAVVERACAVIEGLDSEALVVPRSIQGYEILTQTAVVHVVEHFAFHAGQIIHATKWLADVDLSLYDPQGRRIDGRGNP